MGTKGGSGEIIILSDEEDADASVVLVEVQQEAKNKESRVCASAGDEDLVVMFSKRPDLLPHARYDCPVQPFMATECEVSAPAHNNHLICEQCFCYVCDKLASKCEVWSYSDVCHCNSHNKSKFWNNQRNSALLGDLQTFNLTLCEIDSHLRQAETLLRTFKAELSLIFSAYLSGRRATDYGLTVQGNVLDYTPVFMCVSSFLDLAEKQDSRAGAIMQLGATEAFVRHYPTTGTFIMQVPLANAFIAVPSLLNRVIATLQKQFVAGEFTPKFSQKLQDFYKKLMLPTQLKALKNSLCVRPWEDVLLVSVLRGQNVSGVRTDRGKKDVLLEHNNVVQLRVELLQQQNRYRELCRYLRVVKTEDPKVLQVLLDLMPFFLCADGKLNYALQTLMTMQGSSLSPSLFLSYLHICNTATIPVQILRKQSDLYCTSTWKPIEHAVPLKRLELVRFVLKAQALSRDVGNDTQWWCCMLMQFSSPPGSDCGLPEPSAEFLHESRELVPSILQDHGKCSLFVPLHFLKEFPDQALLLLLTEALAHKLQEGLLNPLLPVLCCFQKNVWALCWLWERLSSCDHFWGYLSQMFQEKDTDKSFDFLHALPLPSTHTDHS